MAQVEAGANLGVVPQHCSFELLGPLRVLRHGEPIRLGGRQQRAVLARLIVERNATVSIDRLVHALWGERPRDGAVTTVQTYVSHLREALEPDRPRGSTSQLLVTEAHGYRLRVEESDVDAGEFERRVAAGRRAMGDHRPADGSAELAAALALWRGEVLADLSDFEFVRETATRFEGMRLTALENRVDADLALGLCQEVAEELDHLTRLHPLREGLHGQRMLALYRCGRQAEALRAYEYLRDRLAGDLGIDPNPEVQRLHLAILRQDPGLVVREPSTTLSLSASDGAGPAGPGDRSVSDDRSEVAPQVGAGASPPRRARSTRHAVAVVTVVGLLLGAVVSSSGPPRRHPLSSMLALAANSVGRLDASDVLDAAVAVGQSPAGLAYGAKSLWVANEGAGTVSRLDPRDGRVQQTVDVGAAPNAVAITGDDVWVVNGADGTVSRVNALINRVVQTIDVGNQPSAIGAGAGGVWVANTADDTVQRIDPRSGVPGPEIDVGGRPSGVAVAGGTIWVSNALDGTVSRIDAGSGQPLEPVSVGAGPRGITATPSAVWVANSLELSVSRIDPATGRVVQVLRVGDGPRSVVAAGGYVWVGDEFDGVLQRIDASTNQVSRTLRLGSSLRGLAVVGRSLWVTSGSSLGSAHHGGTLRVEGWPVPGFDTVDPARSIFPATFTMAYDGLVSQHRTGGTDGTTLVPDLATTLPRPTDGGRTYTFTLRRGIHYADGRSVVAGDIARGVKRALAAGQSYYSGIVGARSCVSRLEGCDLRRGVVTDDKASRVTFHLRRADPDFLGKLSVFVYAAPPGTPLGDPGRPIPGTGPYMVIHRTHANQRQKLTMVRNPFFHQWSFAARPDGYPDRVEWRRVTSVRLEIRDLLSGRADVSDPYTSSFSSSILSRMSREHPALVHSDPSMGTLYEWLNTRMRPFDKVLARRALNLAVDRSRMARLYGGVTKVTASCQVLPPNLPSYRRYCPYSASGRDGRRGPDIRGARRLVRASGTVGSAVSVWRSPEPNEVGPSRYLARVLREIGYRARVRVHPADMSGPGRKDQMGEAWWGVDFPSASNVWGSVLSCDSVGPTPAAGLNRGGFCDHRIDRLAHRALDAQLTDPARARDMWALVDRRLTDAAPWVAGPVTRFAVVVSRRIGNYQSHPVLGPLIDQMWVR